MISLIIEGIVEGHAVRSHGYEATRRIKADPAIKGIPIIAVSSFAMKGDKEKARAAGCDHYVTKPYSPMQLLKVIRGLLGHG